jgi:hypothetical protein
MGEVSERTVRGVKRRGRQRRIAWLAVAALLLDALLPVAFAGAASPPDAPQIGFCRANAPGIPGKAPVSAPAHHCALCLVAMVALPPPRDLDVAGPLRSATPLRLSVSASEAPAPLHYRLSAEPRAPPRAA